jgi:hypothetical protein
MEMFNIKQEIVSSLNDSTDEELLSFPGLHENPTNDVQIEVFIYVCFLIFTRTGTVSYLEQAQQWAKVWATSTPEENTDRERRSEIFNMTSVRIWQSKHEVEDLDYER